MCVCVCVCVCACECVCVCVCVCLSLSLSLSLSLLSSFVMLLWCLESKHWTPKQHAKRAQPEADKCPTPHFLNA